MSRRISSVILAVALSAALAGLGRAADDVDAASDAGSVAGAVELPGGAPVAGVRVSVETDAQKIRATYQATTDEAGKFEVTGIPEGGYNLKCFTADGKSRAIRSIQIFAGHQTKAGILTLRPR